MKILVTGRRTSGSWPIRGEQLGLAIGATVEYDAKGVAGCELVVIVKRPRISFVAQLHAWKIPVVWDVVDAWPQPAGNYWDRITCMRWLRSEVAALRPVAIVAATQAMERDCAEFELPVLALPHHARPNQLLNPIRQEVKLVGYQGGEQYLGSWREIVAQQCKLRGWRFVVNPVTLAEVDIVVALRCQQGYAPRYWKSNVKLANAQGTGTPCVLEREAGYTETACGAERFVNSASEFGDALDSLRAFEVRSIVSKNLLAAAPHLDLIAERYKGWLLSKFSQPVMNPH
jgi:hypothetical protein